MLNPGWPKFLIAPGLILTHGCNAIYLLYIKLRLRSSPKIILRFCVLPNDDHLVYDTQSIFLYKGLSNFGLPSNLRHKVLDNVMTPASFISIVGVPISWVIHYLMLTTIFYAINMTDIFKSLMMNHGILQYMV